jgi:hypothetical protein
VGDLDLAPNGGASREASPPAREPEAHELHGRRRRLVFRLRRAARVLEQGERVQELVYGALLAALALALPSATPLGPDELVRRLSGEPVTTYGLMLPLAQGLVYTTGATPEQALRVIAAVCYGLAFVATLALLRGLGFRRTSSVPAALAAFLAPVAWQGATSPSDFAPGIFGASALLWSLLRLGELVPRDYQWRAILLLGLALLLRPENVLLLPAVAWAVARHPARPHEATVAYFSVFCVVAFSVAISLSGPSEDLRIEHFVVRTLGGADPSARGWIDWPVWAVTSFGVALIGLHALLLARRPGRGQRGPRWLVPWCVVALAPVVVGHPKAGPIGAFLVPAMALGLADALNRAGGRRTERHLGLALIALQLVLAAAT